VSLRSRRSSTRSQKSSRSNDSSRSSGRRKNSSERKSRSNRGISSGADRVEKSPWSDYAKANPGILSADRVEKTPRGNTKSPRRDNSNSSQNNPRLAGSAPRKWGNVPEARIKKSGEFSSDNYISPLDRVRISRGCSETYTMADYLDDSQSLEKLSSQYRKSKTPTRTVMTADDFMGAAGNSEADLNDVARLDEFEKRFGELALEDEEELDGTQKLSNLTTKVVVVEHKPRGRRSSMVSEMTEHGESDYALEGAPARELTSTTIEKLARVGGPTRRRSLMSELSHGTAGRHDHDAGDDDKYVESGDRADFVRNAIPTHEPDVGVDSFEEGASGPSPTNMRVELAKQNSLTSVTSEISMDRSNRPDRSDLHGADGVRSEQASDSEQPPDKHVIPVGNDKSSQIVLAKKPKPSKQSRRGSALSMSHDDIGSPQGFAPGRPDDVSLGVNLERLNLRWGTTGDKDLAVDFPDISGSFNQSAAWERVSSILAEEEESEGGDSLGELERKNPREQFFSRPERFRLNHRNELDSERSVIKETIKEENSDDALNVASPAISQEEMYTSNQTPRQLRRQLSERSHTERSHVSQNYDNLSQRWAYWNESAPIESPLPVQARFLSPAIARKKSGTAWGRMSALFLDNLFQWKTRN
jgi:hypothetical protein